MGRIPVVVSSVPSRAARTSGSIRSQSASASDFGGQTAQALGQVAQGANELARGFEVQREQRAQETVANAVAQSDFTRRELELRNEVGPGAEGYQERTLEAYDEYIDEQAEGITDDAARAEFVRTMQANRNNVSQRSASYELGTAAEHSKAEANRSLDTLTNKVRVNPGSYDEVVAQGQAVINARSDLPANVRSAMNTAWRETAALSRFEGALDSATTREDVQAIQDALGGKGDRDWQAELSPQGAERILSLASSAATSIATRADADARAAVEFLEGRAQDPTTLIPREELQAAQAAVNLSANPMTAARLGRVMRDQEIIRETRRLTPGQQRARVNSQGAVPGIPTLLNTAITAAGQAFGVSTSYLAATAKREYGMYLDGDNTDYSKGNAEGASSAGGVMQIIDSTFLATIRDPRVQMAAGINIEGMSSAQILELRKDPGINVMVGAALTARNAATIRGITGRAPTDAELYMAHFMGGGGASQLLRLKQNNPDANAAEVFAAQAKANPTIFYNGDGRARTVTEVYNELSRKHGGSAGDESAVAYGDRETAEKVLADTEARLADDPMQFSSSVGTSSIGDIFEPGGMEQRGEQARAVSDYYGISNADMKPFTQDEASALSKYLKEEDADAVLGVIASIQGMGGAMAEAGLRQVGQTDPTYAFAGGLQRATGSAAVAGDVIRGQKRLEENPDIRKQVGVNADEISTAFLTATGGALFDASPRDRQNIQDAALAHYVETQVARGAAGSFDEDAFTASVQAVMGGTAGSPAVDTVNGESTVMPVGVDGEMMEEALQSMTEADWAGMSVDGQMPLYADGSIARADDLADDAVLRSVGGGRYRVRTSDGKYLVTGDATAEGRLKTYLFTPTAQSIRDVTSRRPASAPAPERPAPEVQTSIPSVEPGTGSQSEDVAAAYEDGKLTAAEQSALFTKYGAQWAYDGNGQRIAPVQ